MSIISPTLQPLMQHQTLRDGTRLMIRRIVPEDAIRLQEFHERLHFETIYLRYLEYHKELTRQEAARLCTVDYQNRMAFVATLEANGEERIVGVARFDRLNPDLAQTAEVAIVIEDAYQRRGLGSLLFQRLISYARFLGIQKFVATFLFENAGFLKLIRHSGLPLSLISVELGVLKANILLNTCPCI